MRSVVALVLALTTATAAADEPDPPDTDLRPFRDDDDPAARIDMHVSAAPCQELGKACKVVASKTIGGRLVEVYRSEHSTLGEEQTIAIMLVIHVGKQLLASRPITAGFYSKLGAYSVVDGAEVRLQAVGAAAVLEVTTSNTWHEQRTTPPERTAWRVHAFLACRIADAAGTCWFVSVGGRLSACTATRAQDVVHATCGKIERDIALHE